MVKPNLFIIGAMKAGTTSLHHYLSVHPHIFMSEVKEPAFFIDRREQTRPSTPKAYWNDLDSYLALFAGAGQARFLGESTTDYTKLPKRTGVAKRMHDFNPEARLIYIMRDPVERTISHYWWDVWQEGETRDIVTAICTDSFYREVSDYAMQLEPYLEWFGPEQVKTITLEELDVQRPRILRELFAWLGVDISFVPQNLRDQMNSTPAQMTQLRTRGWLQSFRTSALWNAFGPYTPRFVRHVGRRLVERRVDRAAAPLKEVVEFLRPIQQEQTDRLSRLLGRDFPEWKRLWGRFGAVETELKANTSTEMLPVSES
jgi:hypothetical protein